MSSETNNYKRIAKNTVMLYSRFLIMMLISLFTSRVILKTLGFNDFGLYNVVGGFVTLLAFLNGYISQGTVRFLTFSLGQNDQKKLNEVFTASLTLHIFLAFLIFIFGETFGLWYVENKLNIEAGRESIAIFVYHLSLVTGCLSVIMTPFTASITSHEDMGIYAYISIFDIVMKLIIVYLLLIVNTDKLRMYAIFYFIVSLMTTSFYFLFCKKKYPECSCKLKTDFQLYKQMFNYIGWNAIGAIAFTLNGQGITILLNIFFGTIINAARGVAGSISNIVSQFVFNFQTAMRPQIIKKYAEGNLKEMEKIIVYCAKYSSYLCMLFGIPLFLESHSILSIWLGKVPPNASVFVQLTIIQIMFQSMDFPVGYGINAVGKMKLPNLTSSFVYLLVLPVSYICLKLGAGPTIAYATTVLAFPFTMLFDVLILNKYINFKISHFYFSVVLKTIVLTIVSSIIPLVIHIRMEEGWHRVIIVSISSIMVTILVLYTMGIDDKMRLIIKNRLIEIIKTIRK